MILVEGGGSSESGSSCALLHVSHKVFRATLDASTAGALVSIDIWKTSQPFGKDLVGGDPPSKEW